MFIPGLISEHGLEEVWVSDDKSRLCKIIHPHVWTPRGGIVDIFNKLEVGFLSHNDREEIS